MRKKVRKTPQCARIYFRERTSDVLLYRVNIAKEPKFIRIRKTYIKKINIRNKITKKKVKENRTEILIIH